jgi:hypothetical protein
MSNVALVALPGALREAATSSGEPGGLEVALQRLALWSYEGSLAGIDTQRIESLLGGLLGWEAPAAGLPPLPPDALAVQPGAEVDDETPGAVVSSSR